LEICFNKLATSIKINSKKFSSILCGHLQIMLLLAYIFKIGKRNIWMIFLSAWPSLQSFYKWAYSIFILKLFSYFSQTKLLKYLFSRNFALFSSPTKKINLYLIFLGHNPFKGLITSCILSFSVFFPNFKIFKEKNHEYERKCNK